MFTLMMLLVMTKSFVMDVNIVVHLSLFFNVMLRYTLKIFIHQINENQYSNEKEQILTNLTK